MQKDSKIYIAGHGGLVGSGVVKKLKAEGFANIITRTRQELDLFDIKAVSDFFQKEKPEFVILTAAKVGGIKANSQFPADFLYENLMIQNNVIWQAHLNGVKKLLFLGSSCIYPRASQQPMREEYFLTGPFEPTNEAYAVAKTAGIKMCEYIFTQFKKSFISCMPTNIYGENDNFDPESSHVIPGLIRRMHDAKINNLPEVVIWGTGVSRREFLHTEDLADAIIVIMKEYNGKSFINIGTGEDVSIKELAEMIKNAVDYKGKLVFDETKPDGMPKKLLDVSKLNKLGWKYKVALGEGLKAEYQWFLENIANTR